MYNYKAHIIKIIDGDTVDAVVDVGFSISVQCRLRINNFDAPESWRPKTDSERIHGEAAKLFVISLLQDKIVMIYTYKIEVYNRYSADIILNDGRDFARVMKEAGFEKLKEYL